MELRVALVVLCASIFSCAKRPAEAELPPPLSSDNDRTLYALGVNLASSLEAYQLTPAEALIAQRGFVDGVRGQKEQPQPVDLEKKLAALRARRVAATAQAHAKTAADFLATAATQTGTQKLPSGVLFIDQAQGKGKSPSAMDTVKLNYRGTLTDGSEFDSTYGRGQPAQFTLNSVITCWRDGVAKMSAGAKARLICPPETAYGEAGSPPSIPPNAALIFDIELLEVLPRSKGPNPWPN